MDILATLGSAITLCGTASKIATELKHADLRLAIAELKEQLADAKNAALDWRTEIQELKAEIERLRNPPVKVVKGLYFTESGDGPFCTGCYDRGHNLIRLNDLPEIVREMGRWRCPVCKSHFQEG